MNSEDYGVRRKMEENDISDLLIVMLIYHVAV